MKKCWRKDGMSKLFFLQSNTENRKIFIKNYFKIKYLISKSFWFFFVQIFHWIFMLPHDILQWVCSVSDHSFWLLALLIYSWKCVFLSVGRGKKPCIQNCSEGFFLALHFTTYLCLNFVLQWFYAVRDSNWFVLALTGWTLFLSLSSICFFWWTKDTEKCKFFGFFSILIPLSVLAETFCPYQL